MARGPVRSPDEERRRLFKHLEWLFVIAPPLIAVAVAVGTGAFLAWFFRVEGTTFYGRWAAASALLILGPLLAYGVRALWERRR